MHFHLQKLVIAIILLSSTVTLAQKGWWLFDNTSNLTEAVPGYGNDLILVGSHTAVAGPSIGNGAIEIGVGSHYKLNHGIAPNGGGTRVNEYTLMFDFKVSTIAAWHTFYQTDTVVTGSDGDFFKNTSGMLGTWALNYSTTPITVDTWYRLVVAVDLGTSFKSYLNGTLLLAHASQLVDDRWSLAPHLFLFGDDDGDDGLIQVAEVAIWDYALSEIEIAALGGPGTALPVELTSFTASASNDIITLNWETASEVNNSGFSIERKGQAAEWKSIGFVPGYGTSAEKHNYSFNDKLNAPGKYFYRLKQIDQNGQYNYSKEVEVVVTPSEFKLYNNYPNPFNPSTTISYNLSADAVVSLRVYNSVGELVTELFNGTQSAGFYEVQFHSNMNNINLASGIYLVELRANQNVQRIKMILNK